jgi:hypothetical protein
MKKWICGNDKMALNLRSNRQAKEPVTGSRSSGRFPKTGSASGQWRPTLGCCGISGNQYPDLHSKFLAGEDSYVLLTGKRNGPMTVEIKNLGGKVLDRRECERRGRVQP